MAGEGPDGQNFLADLRSAGQLPGETSVGDARGTCIGKGKEGSSGPDRLFLSGVGSPVSISRKITASARSVT